MTLRRIVTRGIESVLLPADFAAVGRRLWVQRERELLHLIALGFRYGSYGIELGIVSPEATEFVWGHPAKEADFGDVVVHGRPSNIRWPAAWEHFEVGDQEDPAKIDEMAREIADGMTAVATWLGQFQTRLQLRAYLLEDSTPRGGSSFVVPSPALKAYIVAVLAVLDHDPAAAHRRGRGGCRTTLDRPTEHGEDASPQGCRRCDERGPAESK